MMLGKLITFGPVRFSGSCILVLDDARFSSREMTLEIVINLPSIMTKFAEEITPSFRRGACVYTPIIAEKEEELPDLLIKKGKKRKCAKM
jgi:hypothetical protein